MKISCKTFLPAFSILALVSCSDVNKRARDYMLETNRTQSELNELTKSGSEHIIQTKLDSIAYRDIFNSTQASKDSGNIANFNKIASSMKNDSISLNMWNAMGEINKKLIDAGITVKDYNAIKDKDRFYRSDVERVNTRQHYADDWAYRKFFKHIGILNDSIAKKCDEVSKKIRPY